MSVTNSTDLIGRAPGGRKLIAVVYADMVGYSHLIGLDDIGTLERLRTLRRTLIDPAISEHGGEVVQTGGDSLLIVFDSIDGAVRCALTVQQQVPDYDGDQAPHQAIRFRIGINIGDVIADGTDLHGDGVNVVARLQAICPPGGICVSRAVRDHVHDRLDLKFEELGTLSLKNISRSVEAFVVRREPKATEPRFLSSSRRTFAKARPISNTPVAFRKAHLPRLMVAGVGSVLTVSLGGSLRAIGAAFDPVRVPIVARPLRKRVGLAATMMVAAALALPVSTMLVERNQAEHALLPDEHSIAVLPFLNMSSDPEQEYFSDGMTEDLITDLSRLTGLFVIARNSVFTFKGRPIRAEQASRELGVRYLVEGSVRKVNNRVRITAQLIDGSTGYHVWAEYYDRDLHDIFTVQEEIARRITGALAVKLTSDEEKYMGQRYTSSDEVWKLFMQGAELYRRFTPEDNRSARAFFERAVALDPKFARGYANIAATHRQDYYGRWSPDPEASKVQAYVAVQIALKLANNEPEPKPSLPSAAEQEGWLALYDHHYINAARAAETVIQRNHNSADGYILWAQVLVYSGQPQQAVEKLDEASKHNPKFPYSYDYIRGQAHYVWGVQTSAGDPDDSRQHFEEAEKYFQAALLKNDNYRPARSYLAAVLIALGRLDDAKAAMKISLEKHEPLVPLLRSGDQALIKKQVRAMTPFEDQMISDRLEDAWLKAAAN
jgi:adenylate cyclase